MHTKAYLLISAALLAGCATTGTSAPRDGAATLAAVETAMGTENLSSISVTGRAWTARNGFRQTRTASPPWYPLNEIMEYRRTIDLTAPASLATGQTYAENIFHEPPVWGNYTQNIQGTQTWAQQHTLWLTPWGFLAGAEANGATVSTVNGQRVLSWQSPENVTSPSGMRYTVNAYLNDDNLIEKTETWVDDAFMGDMNVSVVYRDYREVDGVMVPGVSELWQGGGALFGAAFVDADANPTNLAELMTPPPPPPGAGGPPPGAGGAPQTPVVEELAPGVYLIPGSYNTLVVEFENELVLFESGSQGPARGDEVLAAVKTISDKPIRGVANSHPHSDHSGGLVPLVAAGVPVIVSENSVDFMRMALSTPRTLLGQETLDPQFETVPADEPLIIEDSMNRLELHTIDNLHTDSMLLAYLPEHRLAMQADFTIRVDQEGDTLPASGQTVLIRQLAEYVRAHDMQFDRLLSVHASPNQFGVEDVLIALPEE